MNPELLKKAEASIQVNLNRVAKKLHKDNAAAAKDFVEGSMSRIKVCEVAYCKVQLWKQHVASNK